ncbi:MAG: HYR domain-containing protein, partial [Bacteroidales bacterium]|nr:HYR domain-containing protein [Bacteroidales bacterium]
AGLAIDISTFNCGDIGANTVTLTVTDNNGNTDQCQSTVTVIDTISPSAVCQDIDVYLDAAGNASIVAADVDGGSSDACGIGSLAIDISAFTCANVGANTVTLTVTDNNANTDQCTSTVTVIDTISPSAVCQDIDVYLDAAGNASIVAADVDGGSSDACGIAGLAIDISAFTCANVGANTVTLTVTDNNGNTDQCQSTVTVIDTISPSAVCQDIDVYLDAAGNASIVAADVDGGSSDACGIAGLAIDISTFNCGDIGANTVTLTVTDNNANTDQCTATVTVIDTISPSAVCQDIDVYLDAAGNASIVAADVDGGSTDACGIASLAIDISAFTCANVGANTVTLTVTDNNANTDQCTATVTVIDTISPSAVCQDIDVYLDAAGNASIVAADVDGGSSDACGIGGLAIDINTFTCGDIGANTVTLTVTDNYGNSSQCQSTVTVIDTISPAAVCQDITVPLDISGNATITAAMVDNGTSDNCGIDTMYLDRYDFTCADIGANAVTLTVEDVNGNSATCNATVTISEVEPPVASCQDTTIYLHAAGTVIIDSSYVNNGSTDNCGIATITLDRFIFDCIDAGANTVTMTVTDNYGNSSSCPATVTVVDTVSPIALCTDTTVYLDATGNFTIDSSYVDDGSNDACGIQSITPGQSAFDCSHTGPNLITITVTDNNGNTSQCNSTITVIDTISPSVTCMDTTIYLDVTGSALIDSSFILDTAFDACGLQSTVIGQSTFDCTNAGIVPVTVTVTDIYNNISTCIANVTVLDTIPPAVTCPNDSTVVTEPGRCSAEVLNIAPGVSDNCSVSSIAYRLSGATTGTGIDDASGESFNEGLTSVSYTIYDPSGNSDSCTFNITVIVTSSPPDTALTNRNNICPADGNIIMTYSGGAVTEGGDAQWYNDPLLANNIGSGNNLTLATPDSTTTYYVRFEGPCDTTLAKSVTVSINTLSVAPESAASDRNDICHADGNITLSYTGGSLGTAATAEWYSDATFTTHVGSGNNLSITAPLATTKYFVRFEGTCNSTIAKSVTVNIKTLSIPPESASRDRDTICPGDGNITLTYTGGIPGSEAVARWYNSATFTAPLGDGNNLVVPAPSVSTNYYVRFEGPCDTSDAVFTRLYVIRANESPDNVLIDRNNICSGDGDITLTYSGGLLSVFSDAQWYDDAALSNIIGTGSQITVSAPDATTTYYVRFEGSCDTSSAVSATLNIKAISLAPDAALTNRDTVCPADGLILLTYTGGVIGSNAAAVWYSDAALTNSVGTGNNISVTAPAAETTYYVRIEDECDTTETASVTVYLFTIPQPVFHIQTPAVCINSDPVLYVVDGLAGSTYSWSTTGGSITHENNDTIYIDWGSDPDDYSITVIETTITGCVSEESVLDVVVSTPTIDLGPDPFICASETAIIDPTGDFISHIWHNGTGTSTYMTRVAEVVSILVFDEYGCMVSDSVTVTVAPDPLVDFGPDTLLCGSMTLDLDAGNPGSTYNWSTGETSEIITIYPGPQVISVLVTSEYGCIGGDTIRILDCSTKAYFARIPNAFTPNGDNVNDTWYFDEAAAFPDIVIEIFDRWGKVIFKSEKGYPEPWDGRAMNGREMPMDSYFYVIDPGDGTGTLTGTVTIIR